MIEQVGSSVLKSNRLRGNVVTLDLQTLRRKILLSSLINRRLSLSTSISFLIFMNVGSFIVVFYDNF